MVAFDRLIQTKASPWSLSLRPVGLFLSKPSGPLLWRTLSVSKRPPSPGARSLPLSTIFPISRFLACSASHWLRSSGSPSELPTPGACMSPWLHCCPSTMGPTGSCEDPRTRGGEPSTVHLELLGDRVPSASPQAGFPKKVHPPPAHCWSQGPRVPVSEGCPSGAG